MNIIRASLWLYFKAAWPVSLGAAFVALALFICLPCNDSNSVAFAVTTLAAILIFYVCLCHRFTSIDLQLLSSGVTPTKRLLAIVAAYILASTLAWLAYPIAIHFQLRSLLLAFIHQPPDTQPAQLSTNFWVFASCFLLVSLAFVESHMRALAGYAFFEYITLHILGIALWFYAVPLISITIHECIYGSPGNSPWESLFLGAAAIAALSRLWPLIQLPFHSSHTPRPAPWQRPTKTPMPLGTRIADAAMALCLSYMLLRVTLITPLTLDSPFSYRITHPENLPYLYAINALLAAVLFTAVVLVLRDRLQLALSVFAVAIVIAMFPCMKASASLVSSANAAIPKQTTVLFTDTNHPRAQAKQPPTSSVPPAPRRSS